jgi:hypothetical protein
MSDVLNEVADEQLDVQAQHSKSSKRKVAAPKAKVRKHLVTTVYKNDAAAKLDKLYAAGHTVLAVVASSDVRGFEVISYNEE